MYMEEIQTIKIYLFETFVRKKRNSDQFFAWGDFVTGCPNQTGYWNQSHVKI